jgi:hypothetical protein
MKKSANNPSPPVSKASRSRRQQSAQQQRIRQLLRSFETPGEVARQAAPKAGL